MDNAAAGTREAEIDIRGDADRSATIDTTNIRNDGAPCTSKAVRTTCRNGSARRYHG